MTNLEQLKQNLEQTLPEMIARKDIEKYTGGMYKLSTMQCYDHRGTGPKNRIKLKGRGICYTKEALIEWLLARIEEGESK